MKRRYEATGAKATKTGLNVYVTVHVGTAIRFITVCVPWAILLPLHQEIVEQFERIYVAQLEADANVQYLPLEAWE